ncbi:hypothetical protein BDV41DRAFT_517345 [Aspergillus transmontanensis]|uniref:Uncharacterized protein n=1 Tax=Aspergillus transmontanensis TaxID=1034304 RepID=A0A5N6WKH8_9EURO|nr:hypothetical protein BDV41DRAFT_517345 [Aspergillus transmontanensis]
MGGFCFSLIASGLRCFSLRKRQYGFITVTNSVFLCHGVRYNDEIDDDHEACPLSLVYELRGYCLAVMVP